MPSGVMFHAVKYIFHAAKRTLHAVKRTFHGVGYNIARHLRKIGKEFRKTLLGCLGQH